MTEPMQELCECPQFGHRGLPVPDSPYCLWGCKATSDEDRNENLNLSYLISFQLWGECKHPKTSAPVESKADQSSVLSSYIVCLSSFNTA